MELTNKAPSGGLLNRCKTDPLITFQRIEKIGQGIQSEVYKALNKITDKLATIRIFHFTQNWPSEEDIEFLKSLEHPFIDKILDVYLLDQQIWLISEYYQLGSISDVMSITKQPLSEPEISCVCYSVLYALDYIHAMDRVHMGIKNSNILVNSLGQIKLTDFDHMLWKPIDISKRTNYEYANDIWNLGVCVIEMLKGCEISNQKINRFTTSELNDFLDQCLQPDISKRPKAVKLLEHPFISKYKPALSQIRKKFSQDRMEKITEFKKKNIVQMKSNGSLLPKPQYEGFAGEENIIDESDIPNNTVGGVRRLNNFETAEISLGSENYLSFVEKPSFSFTDAPSHIEPINQNQSPNFDDQEPISQIKHQHYDDSQDFDNGPDVEQLSIALQSPRFELVTDKIEKIGVRVPPLKLGGTAPLHRGKMPTIDSRFSSENTHRKSKGNKDEISKGVGSSAFRNITTKQALTGRLKMYKVTNESNFVVKHTFGTAVVGPPPDLSAATETSVDPITLDEQKQAQITYESGTNSTIQMVEGLENLAAKVTRVNNIDLKELTPSTIVNSKSSSGIKSVFYAPNPNDNKQNILKVVKENLEYSNLFPQESPRKHGERPNVEAERIRLEEQMKRELNDVRRKYSGMMKGLEKSREVNVDIK